MEDGEKGRLLVMVRTCVSASSFGDDGTVPAISFHFRRRVLSRMLRPAARRAP